LKRYLVIKSIPNLQQLIGTYNTFQEAKFIMSLVSLREVGKYKIIKKVIT